MQARIPIFRQTNPGGEMMSIDETAGIEQTRRWFAEELRHTAHVRSPALRRPPEEPDDTCWLAGEGWWLSTAPVEEAPRDP
jgi:hypothetical protein